MAEYDDNDGWDEPPSDEADYADDANDDNDDAEDGEDPEDDDNAEDTDENDDDDSEGNAGSDSDAKIQQLTTHYQQAMKVGSQKQQVVTYRSIQQENHYVNRQYGANNTSSTGYTASEGGNYRSTGYQQQAMQSVNRQYAARNNSYAGSSGNSHNSQRSNGQYNKTIRGLIDNMWWEVIPIRVLVVTNILASGEGASRLSIRVIEGRISWLSVHTDNRFSVQRSNAYRLQTLKSGTQEDGEEGEEDGEEEEDEEEEEEEEEEDEEEDEE
ncbi:MAG: hypothetical protein M1829_000955 [Trizodia sp. TS-e1964]|nr:MAG: hypothetical protein M1829_000955 [Trizodia sp. TS-e1964]